MHVLVTGGGGFIGSHLVAALLQRGDSVRVVDNFSTGRRDNLQPMLDRIDLIEGDVQNAAVAAAAVDGIDVVLHEAAIPSVPQSVSDPIGSHDAGATATLVLLEAARKANVRRVVLASTCAVYGDDPSFPKSESAPLITLSPYAATKLAGEHYAQAFARCFDLDTVALRYFNVFGPRQDPSSPYSGVISIFCRAFIENRDITIFGDGSQTRDFVYVENVVQANLKAADCRNRFAGAAVNVGTGRRTSLLELIETLQTITGETRPVHFGPERVGDVRHSQADITLARDLIGYDPAVELRTGLERTLAWFRAK